jgi:hypothetical protein
MDLLNGSTEWISINDSFLIMLLISAYLYYKVLHYQGLFIHILENIERKDPPKVGWTVYSKGFTGPYFL